MNEDGRVPEVDLWKQRARQWEDRCKANHRRIGELERELERMRGLLKLQKEVTHGTETR
jgi:hypothetical protein